MNIPKGYKLVPIQLTESMREAALGVDEWAQNEGQDQWKPGQELIWEELLSAAPTPPQPITALEFVDSYCQRSGISKVEFYESQVPLQDPTSPSGWAAVSNNPILIMAHVEAPMEWSDFWKPIPSPAEDGS